MARSRGIDCRKTGVALHVDLAAVTLTSPSSGETSKAEPSFEEAIAYDRSLASTVEIPSLLSVLAKVHAELGQFDEARRCIGEAIALGKASGERWWEAEFHRTAGEIELMSPERDAVQAQTSFERALETARAQQARSFELRAATGLARLWRYQGRHAEARSLLAPITGGSQRASTPLI